MSWIENHRESEILSAEARALYLSGEYAEAQAKYALAAASEERALALVPTDNPRTLGIISVSASALWFKGKRYREAEQLIHRVLTNALLPAFARNEMRGILQAIWTEEAKMLAGVGFLPGQVLVAIQGGTVVSGGAPLDLVVEKVKSIQSMFYRTIEYVRGDPFRARGRPPHDLHEACRPWLFQEAPGSYQFSVAVERPKQPDFFRDQIQPEAVVERFLEIIRAGIDEEPTRIVQVVPDERYRKTFLNLTQNLIPGGKLFDQLEIGIAGGEARLTLERDDRPNVRRSLDAMKPQSQLEPGKREEIKGVLRALHLDKDWVEVSVGTEWFKIESLPPELDDAIGAMVNRPVTVQALTTETVLRGKKTVRYRLQHIQLDD